MVNSKVPKTASKKTASKKVKRTPKLKIYCGIGDLDSKKQRMGSMKECLDLKQIRYYGVKKVDSKLIDSVKPNKETEKTLIIKIAGLRGRISKMKRDFANTKKIEEKKQIINDVEKIQKEILMLNEKILKLQKKSKK